MRGLMHAAFLLWGLHHTVESASLKAQSLKSQSLESCCRGARSQEEAAPMAGQGSTAPSSTELGSSVPASRAVPGVGDAPERTAGSIQGTASGPSQEARESTAEQPLGNGHTAAAPHLLSPLLGRIVGGVAKQSVEKIVGTREVAGRMLQALVWRRLRGAHPGGRGGGSLGGKQSSSVSSFGPGAPFGVASPGNAAATATASAAATAPATATAAAVVGGSGREGGGGVLALPLPARELLEEATPAMTLSTGR